MALVGCGLEGAGTAATVGKLEAKSAEKAKKDKAELDVKLGKAMNSAQDRDRQMRGATANVDPAEADK